MYYVCYGDSNTYGYDSRPALGAQYPESVRWTCLLEKWSGDTFENQGFPGRTIPIGEKKTRMVADLLLKRKEEYGDVTLLTMLGSNNILMHEHTKAEDVAEKMETFLLDIIKMTDGKIPIHLISPGIAKPGTWVRGPEVIEESTRLGPLYKALAKKLGIGFTDSAPFDVPVLYDGVHFSEEGNRIFAEKLFTSLYPDTALPR